MFSKFNINEMFVAAAPRIDESDKIIRLKGKFS